MSDNIIPILQKSKLFAGFSPEQLEEVVAHLEPNRLSLESGAVVYAQGKPADRCWLIRSGNLTVMRPSLRKPFRKMIYHVGSVTGIQGLVDPGSPRPVTMIAEDDVKLIEITQAGITSLDDKTQLLLWRNISRLLLSKLGTCFGKLSAMDE
jgi:CRP-like cAMP-binding protein